jgi:hypothetical protein
MMKFIINFELPLEHDGVRKDEVDGEKNGLTVIRILTMTKVRLRQETADHGASIAAAHPCPLKL